MGVPKAILHAFLAAGLGLLGLILMIACGLVLGGAMLMRAGDWSLLSAAVVGIGLTGSVGGFWLYSRPTL